MSNEQPWNQRSLVPIHFSESYFPWAGVENWKWQIESHYPTQAKRRLEWGTQHLLPVWQNHGRSHADSKARHLLNHLRPD